MDVLREIASLRGSRGTLLEHSPVADSQSNGLIERGIRSVEEMTRVLLLDLSSRVGNPISVHSSVFPWIVEHATDILNKCHVASDGKSAYERLKKRPHRGELLPFGTAVMFRVAGKVPGGLMSERWHLGTWLGKRFHTEEHIVARKGDGLVLRSKAVKVMPESTTMDDLDAIKGSPWAPSGVLRDVLPCIHRPTAIRDDPAVEIEEERPVPRNMKITQDILKKFDYTPGCAKCRRLSRNEYSHPSLAHSQDCRIRTEAASKTDPTYRDQVERAEQRKMNFYEKEVEQMDRARKALLEPSTVSRPEMARTDLDDRSSVREAKRAREEPAQDLSGEIPIPSADETLKIPFPVPSDVILVNSSPGQIFQEASSSSGVKRPYNESTTTPNLPGDTKSVCSESTAQPNSPDVSTGSSVKRAHEKSSANDEDEQPASRARISNLISGLHGVNMAEDDEICNGDEVPDEWLDSWYPETHMSQKMVIEAKRKEMERSKTQGNGKIQENESVPCGHKRFHETR